MAQTASVKTDIRKEEPKKSGVGAVVLIFILIIAIAGVGACYWFNVLGMKTKVLTLLGKDVPDTATEQPLTEDEKRAQNEAYFAQLQANLDARQAELDQKELELQTRETTLNDREQKYLTDKAELDTLYTAFENRKADVKEVAKIYDQMDAATASNILTKYSDMNEVSRIIGELTDAKAAEILSEMDPKYASDLLRVVN